MAGTYRCPTLVGRADLLAEVQALVESARGGAGATAVLIGEPGVGKTRLVSETIEHADGLRVLLGRTSSVPGGASMRPIEEAIAGCARAHPDPPVALGGYLPVLARFAPEWGEPSPAPSSPVVMGEALLRLAGAGGPGLVILEDLHWADAATLQVVEYLAHHAPEHRASVLLTARPGYAATEEVLPRLAGAGLATLRVDRLDEAEVAEFARGCWGTDPPAEVLAIVAEADGLPLLIEDLLAAADLAGGGAVGMSSAFVSSVASRLDAIGPPARAVVEAASVLSGDFDLGLLCAITTSSYDDVRPAVENALAAQLLAVRGADTYGFRHALTRDAVLRLLDPRHRAEIAGRAASATEAVGAPDDQVADLHAQAGHRDRAADLFIRAARSERATGSMVAALGLVERARGVAADVEVARRAARLHVELLGDVGRAEEARIVAAELLPYLPRADAAAVRLGLAVAALGAQEPELAAAQLAAATALGGLDDAAWAKVWGLRAGIALAGTSTGRVAEAEHLAHRAVAAAEQAGDPALSCEALLVLGRCARLRDLDAAERAFSRAAAVADGAGLVVARVQSLAELGTIEMLREVTPSTLEEAYRAATTIGALTSAVGIQVNLLGLRTMRGEVEGAIDLARSCRADARRFGMRAAEAAAVLFEGVGHALAGEPVEMERLLREAESISDDPDVRVGSWAIGRGTSALLADDRPRARRAYDVATDAIRAQPVLMIDPAAGPVALLDAVEGTAAVSDLDDAERRSGTGSAWTRMWIDTARAVVAGREGPVDPALVASSADAIRRYPVFGMGAERLLLEACVRDGWGDPLPALEDLELRAAQRGHPRLAAACRSLRRSAGSRVPRARAVDAAVPPRLRRLGVTAREAEVLDLVGERLTNPEIAQRLYLSPRTVEKHVASLMLKTGSRDRVELAALRRETG